MMIKYQKIINLLDNTQNEELNLEQGTVLK